MHFLINMMFIYSSAAHLSRGICQPKFAMQLCAGISFIDGEAEVGLPEAL
jgi:hypothetical protein